jgi:hypothetical protein
MLRLRPAILRRTDRELTVKFSPDERWCPRCDRESPRARFSSDRLICVDCHNAQRRLADYWRERRRRREQSPISNSPRRVARTAA